MILCDGPLLALGQSYSNKRIWNSLPPSESFSRLCFPAGPCRNRFLTFADRSRSLVSSHEFELFCSNPHAAWPSHLRFGERGSCLGPGSRKAPRRRVHARLRTRPSPTRSERGWYCTSPLILLLARFWRTLRDVTLHPSRRWDRFFQGPRPCTAARGTGAIGFGIASNDGCGVPDD